VRPVAGARANVNLVRVVRSDYTLRRMQPCSLRPGNLNMMRSFRQYVSVCWCTATKGCACKPGRQLWEHGAALPCQQQRLWRGLVCSSTIPLLLRQQMRLRLMHSAREWELKRHQQQVPPALIALAMTHMQRSGATASTSGGCVQLVPALTGAASRCSSEHGAHLMWSALHPGSCS
jgi:hypothetical protein